MQETTVIYPFAYIFVIFFLTLGPLKVIPIFNRLCYKASPSFAKKLALKATILSSIIIFTVAIVLPFLNLYRLILKLTPKNKFPR
jgi:small neutral amino acid transporter SnatA (MarC family)